MKKILTINCGSATLKYSLWKNSKELVKGNVERIGQRVKNHEAALKIALGKIKKSGYVKSFKEIKGVGHRVVHGGRSGISKVINKKVIDDLNKFAVLAPLHNPKNLMGIRAAQKLLPWAGHVAVYDTSFHVTIPEVNHTYAIPQKLAKKHFIQKYGYHGTSFRYNVVKLKELKRKNKLKKTDRIIICHLGNGCSIAALKNWKSIDTTMEFSTLSGLVMGTRCGHLDPYLPYFIAKHEKMKIEKVYDMLFKKSGLLGLSGKSNDMRDLIKCKTKSCKLALDVFCYHLYKTIGAYVALLGGLDALVFTAGIGEHEWHIRKRVADKFNFIGMKIDNKKNKKNELFISAKNSKIPVLVIKTDEEKMIAMDAKKLLKL